MKQTVQQLTDTAPEAPPPAGAMVTSEAGDGERTIEGVNRVAGNSQIYAHGIQHADGSIDDGSARFLDGVAISLDYRNVGEGFWQETGIRYTPDEARQAARCLLASAAEGQRWLDGPIASSRPDWKKPSGIPPIDCPSWCDDPGHDAEHCRADQNCYSPASSVVASLATVEINEHGVCESRISAMAYRGFGRYAVVMVHVEGFDHGLDEELRLTAREAEDLALQLMTAAVLIGGAA